MYHKISELKVIACTDLYRNDQNLSTKLILLEDASFRMRKEQPWHTQVSDTESVRLIWHRFIQVKNLPDHPN